MPRVTAASALGAVLVSMTAAARTAPCARPDLVETIPADGATDVPVNAELVARYTEAAEYVAEEVTLERVGFGPNVVPANFSASEGTLTVRPTPPLVPGDTYRVTWPELRGLSAAARGRGAVVELTAGFAEDVEPPQFDGLGSLLWDIERERDECTDALEDRFLFDLSLSAASDDGGRDMLTLLVFQTSGPNVRAGSPVPVLVRRMPTGTSSVHVRRPIDAAVGRVCFAALVRDSVGQISNSADREVCTTTVRPPVFSGCTIASARDFGRGTPTTFAMFAGVVAGCWFWRHRRTMGQVTDSKRTG